MLHLAVGALAVGAVDAGGGQEIGVLGPLGPPEEVEALGIGLAADLAVGLPPLGEVVMRAGWRVSVSQCS